MERNDTRNVYNQRIKELQHIQAKIIECDTEHILKPENMFPDKTKKFILNTLWHITEKEADKHIYLMSHTSTGDIDTCMCYTPDLSQYSPLTKFKRGFLNTYKSTSPLQIDCHKQTRIHLDLLKAQELEGRTIEMLIQLANYKLDGLDIFENALKQNVVILQKIKNHLIDRITSKHLNIDFGIQTFLPTFIEQRQQSLIRPLPRRLKTRIPDDTPETERYENNEQTIYEHKDDTHRLEWEETRQNNVASKKLLEAVKAKK